MEDERWVLGRDLVTESGHEVEGVGRETESGTLCQPQRVGYNFREDAPEGRNRRDEREPLTVPVMQRELIAIVRVVLRHEGRKTLVIVSVANERHLNGRLSELLAAVCARVEQYLIVT